MTAIHYFELLFKYSIELGGEINKTELVVKFQLKILGYQTYLKFLI